MNVIKRIGAFIVLAAFSVSTAGCVGSAAGIAPSTTPITARDSYVELGPATGSAWGGNILFIFPMGAGDTSTAIERALEASGGDALINVTLENRGYFFLVAMLSRVKVNGIAIKMVN